MNEEKNYYSIDRNWKSNKLDLDIICDQIISRKEKNLKLEDNKTSFSSSTIEMYKKLYKDFHENLYVQISNDISSLISSIEKEGIENMDFFQELQIIPILLKLVETTTQSNIAINSLIAIALIQKNVEPTPSILLSQDFFKFLVPLSLDLSNPLSPYALTCCSNFITQNLESHFNFCKDCLPPISLIQIFLNKLATNLIRRRVLEILKSYTLFPLSQEDISEILSFVQQIISKSTLPLHVSLAFWISINFIRLDEVPIHSFAVDPLFIAISKLIKNKNPAYVIPAFFMVQYLLVSGISLNRNVLPPKSVLSYFNSDFPEETIKACADALKVLFKTFPEAVEDYFQSGLFGKIFEPIKDSSISLKKKLISVLSTSIRRSNEDALKWIVISRAHQSLLTYFDDFPEDYTIQKKVLKNLFVILKQTEKMELKVRKNFMEDFFDKNGAEIINELMESEDDSVSQLAIEFNDTFLEPYRKTMYPENYFSFNSEEEQSINN